MKSFSFLLLFSLFSTATFANELPPVTQITLTAGTSLSFTLNDEIESTDAEIGNVIELRLRGNVTVNGKVLLRDGAIAEGEITRVKRNCGDGCIQSISITVTSVQAVDGQRISVQGSHFKRSAECNSCTATIHSGTRLKATVLNDNQINA